MDRFLDEVKAGNIFRKKECVRCGAIDYERYMGEHGHDWEEYSVYEGQGFGSVVINPYVKGMERTEFVLCPACGQILKQRLEKFLEEGTVNEAL